ncbi:iron complex outermembrane receptor protein [Sphingomonas jinjuensis]|uniref:Iron complex outermembrane receptor protein n=1 Tax=Sphingomonas jinjuensis TaxID=535907 RepID=A0A840FC66_9SPHN|nr:TonB-dependent receptor [Sphingomonas jinjuensis]MBB4155610.1 iron complex outermembrane receptor protein [Sphingomonas jinjuensis]
MTISTVPLRALLLRGAAMSLVAALGAGLATPAFAQDATPQQATPAPAAPATTDAEQPQGGDIVVTGTLFRRTDTETPSPVTVLTADNLARAGITTAADAVRSISADNSGSVPTAFANGFGAGSSGVSLRGLTVNSTLTLVDGVRTAYYPLADDGQRSFVDLNTIPNATIDRVQVLKDGASSSYGADAIAGVVNIITKKEITGLSGTVEAGVTGRKDGGEQRATLTGGYGKLSEQGFNVYVSGEYQHDDAIYARKRGFPYDTADLTSIGGDNNNPGSIVPGTTTSAIVAPTTQTIPGNILSGSGIVTGPWQVLNPAGCRPGQIPVSGSAGNGCEQNTARDYGQIQPSQTRYGGTIHGTLQINPDTQAYASISYFQNEVTSNGSPSTIRAANPINTLSIVLPATLSNGQLNPSNPFAANGQAAAIRYLFGDIAQSSSYRNRVLRSQVGITGKFGDGWGYQVDATAAKSWLTITQDGYINLPALTNAINTGSYNFVNPDLNSAAVRSALSPTVVTQATSDLDMIQGTLTKDVFQLPGGPLQVGVGGSFRYEAVNDPNQNASAQTINLNQFTAVGSRKVTSGYFEINAPVLTSLEIDGSGRYDHYSDGFSNFSPKIGAKFTPIRQFAIRGTFSKGFRAPSFAEKGGSVIGFTSARPPCSIQVQHGATANGDGTCSGGSSYNQAYGIGFNTIGDANLAPEKSTSYTGGIIAQPTRWLSLTADYYNIKKTGVITAAPLSNTALSAYYAGGTLPTGYSITPDAIDPSFPNAPRRALFVNGPFANAAALKTSGIDFAAQLSFRPRDDIHFTSRAEATYILHYRFKSDDGSDYVDYVGTQSPYVTSSGAGTPQWRGNWQNSLDVGRYSLNATAYYVDGYKAVGIDQFGGSDCASSSTYQGSDPNFNCRVKSFIDVDLNASMKVNDQFQLYVNVMNLLDARAPLNAGNYAATNYNPTYTQAGAVGRAFRIGANFTF